MLKPLFSREGAGVEIIEAGRPAEASPDRAYSHHPMIVQALAPLPDSDAKAALLALAESVVTRAG